jgi:hypothetical protein
MKYRPHIKFIFCKVVPPTSNLYLGLHKIWGSFK